MNYTREQILLMKQRVYSLRYNLSYDYFDDQKNVFMDLEFNFPEIKNNTNQAVRHEYDRRRISVITKSYWQLDKLDVDIWSHCYLANLHKEIAAYERFNGYVDLELSTQFNDFINNRNNVINQDRLFVKDGKALSYTNIIDTLESALDIAAGLTSAEVPYLDEAMLGVKGIHLAMKARNGTITEKDKIGAGLDLIFYVSEKSTKDEKVKKALKVGSGIVGLCLEFFIGK